MGFDTPDRADMTFRGFVDIDALSSTLKRLNDKLIVQMVWIDRIESAVLDIHPHLVKNTDETPNILDVLNNDCLWAMLEHLDLVDLSEVASTCKQLNSLVTRIFNNRGFDYAGLDNKPLQRIETFFRLFGPYLSSIDANKFRSQQVVLGMISKYCKNVKALSCTVCCQKTLAEITPILWQIKSFEILCGSEIVFRFGKIFNATSPIEQLKLDHSGAIALPRTKLSKLTDLKLCSTYFPDEKGVSNFFQLNKQLKKLHLERVLSLSGCDYILKGLINLEELVLFDYATNHFSPNLPCFAELRNLKKLRVWANIADFGDSFKVLKYSEIQLDYKPIEGYTVRPIVEYDHRRRITGLKLYKPFTTFNLRRSNWITDEMLQNVPSLFPNLKEILVESWKLSLHGILSVLNAAKQLQIATFVIRNAIIERSEPTDVRNALQNIHRVASSRQIRTSIEIVKCDEHVSYRPSIFAQ